MRMRKQLTKGKRPLFVFDLDSTITRREILPLLAEEAGLGEEMAALTERAMDGRDDFAQSFARRVSMLSHLSVSRACARVAQVEVYPEIAAFLTSHRERCLIVTGNLDVWIDALLDRLGMRGRCVCSHAEVRDDRVRALTHILDKREAAKRLAQPYIAVGDGENDLGLFAFAGLSVGFGGARRLSPRVRRAVDIVIDDEEALVRFLQAFV